MSKELKIKIKPSKTMKVRDLKVAIGSLEKEGYTCELKTEKEAICRKGEETIKVIEE